MSAKILEAKKISYFDQLHESSFEINNGFTTLMGPSGSGKSTCVQLLIGALKLSQGEIDYFKNNKKTLTIKPEDNLGLIERFRLESKQNRIVKKHIISYCGYVAQTPELPKDMTVRDYIYSVRTAAGNKLDNNYIEWLLEKLGIYKNINSIAASQSGGEQQRTAIAFALANQPDLLVADEPNASLDTSSGKEVIELIRSLADDGMSVLWITHTPEHQEYSDNRLFAKDGIVGLSPGGLI